MNEDCDDLLVKVKVIFPDLKVNTGNDKNSAVLRTRIKLHPVHRVKMYLYEHDLDTTELFSDSRLALVVDRDVFLQAVKARFAFFLVLHNFYLFSLIIIIAWKFL